MRYEVRPSMEGWAVYDKQQEKYLGIDLKRSEADKLVNNLNEQRGDINAE